jgi:hypothetical protein
MRATMQHPFIAAELFRGRRLSSRPRLSASGPAARSGTRPTSSSATAGLEGIASPEQVRAMLQGLDTATGEQGCAPLWRADPHSKLTAGPLLQALKVRADQQGVEDLEELAGSRRSRGMCAQFRQPAGWAGRGGSRSRRSSASAARCWAPTPASCTAKHSSAPGNIAASEWMRGCRLLTTAFPTRPGTGSVARRQGEQRWCAAGTLNAERSFRRLKGYRQMPTFVAALARHVEAVTPAWDAGRVA